jgi:glutathione S-transferase
MLILYYWPGASSLVPHIVLEEIGAPYERQLVNLAQGDPTFAHIIRPERFATDTAAQANVRDTARKAFWDNCREINRLLDGKEWTMGTPYTVCDPYAFFFYDLGSRIKLPMPELTAYAAFSERMLQRPAVCKVRGLEEDIAKGSNAWHGQYYAQPRSA